METTICIQSKDLAREELRLLIQSIRDCEQKSFPEKEIFILIYAPGLNATEVSEILGGVRPGYGDGPIHLYYKPQK
jgi:hypothetical protein